MGKFALVVVVVVAGVVAGCTHTFSQDVVQPNPLVANNPTARTSERITITRNDDELVVPMSQVDMRDPEAPVVPTEYGPMVKNDKVTSSYGEYFKWPLKTSASWTMVSRDDLLFHIEVDHKWLDYVDLAEWRAELVDDQGRVYTPKAVEHRHARIIYSGTDDSAVTVYRGNGDLVFAAHDLLTTNARWIKLVMQHGVDQFEYTWKFQPSVAAR